MTPVGRGTTSQAPARPHTTDRDTLIADQTSITNQESDAAVDNSKLTSLLHGLPGVDQVGLEGRAATLATRSIKKDSKIWAIDTAISMVDLTTLEGMDTDGKVRSLCAKALHPDPTDPTCPAGGSGLACTGIWWRPRAPASQIESTWQRSPPPFRAAGPAWK